MLCVFTQGVYALCVYTFYVANPHVILDYIRCTPPDTSYLASATLNECALFASPLNECACIDALARLFTCMGFLSLWSVYVLRVYTGRVCFACLHRVCMLCAVTHLYIAVFTCIYLLYYACIYL